MKHTLETIEKAFWNHVKRKDPISASKLKAEIVGCRKELRETTFGKGAACSIIRNFIEKEILGEVAKEAQ